MRISWLTAEEIAVAREALTAGDAGYDHHFTAGVFSPPPLPAGRGVLDWERIVEHVARAERVSEVVRTDGLAAARERFATSDAAIEAATLAAAALSSESLALDEIEHVLTRPIDPYVFYAPFLELMIERGRDDLTRAAVMYEQFAHDYARALEDMPNGEARVRAAFDGLADVYVSAGRIDDAEALFVRRHDEDQRDVAVALSASRAFLAAAQIARAVHWLERAAERANALGRPEQAAKLRQTQTAVRKRLS